MKSATKIVLLVSEAGAGATKGSCKAQSAPAAANHMPPSILGWKRTALLRFDAERAEIWLDDSSILAGIKLLLGADPKEEYKDKVAEVDLG